MRKRTYKIFILRTAAFIFAIIITAGIINSDSLSAQNGTDKSIVTEQKNPVTAEKNSPDKKSDIPKTSFDIVPASTDKNTTGAKDKTVAPDEKIGTSKTPIEIVPASTDKNTTGAKDKTVTPDGKSVTPKTSADITPVNSDKNTPVIKDEKNAPVKKEPVYINAEEIFDHPEIVLNAYKEAYPDLIADVVKGEKDWIVKFTNGNIYYWADGKILPESVLSKSDKYIRYSIYPYNTNGRSPELYTAEKIEKLRVKKQHIRKKKFVPGEEGCLYKELFAITTKKSAKKQLTEVILSGHYIIVHHTIAEKIKSIDSKINELAKTDPEVRSFLKNIGSVSAFNWRKIAGTDRMSNHSYGIAIDILPKKYRKKTIYWSWESEKNEKWMLLPRSSLWTPPVPVIKIFQEENFIWGGNWDRYDTMHFEYRPELICLSKNVKFDQ
ncbi:MAG TPA: M15 family metallopeptidase [Spirochaetota bacterium]|nr:M15 family metallopeptidase [Spirochaetota bacterium]HPS88096.1 M15 family metallopeptidase [Spirochaetota bacterium]